MLSHRKGLGLEARKPGLGLGLGLVTAGLGLGLVRVLASASRSVATASALASTAHGLVNKPVLIHAAIWLQQIWAENWVGCAPLGEGSWVPI